VNWNENSIKVKDFSNEVRLHQSLSYLTPEDEHTGHGAAIRAARPAGLQAAHEARVAARRQLRKDHQ
jgi:putative transposase